MKTILTFGVFDLLHYGHIELFRKAKCLGDFLIVAVQSDKEAQINKPNIKLKNKLEKRILDVKAVNYVGRAIPYKQIDTSIELVDFDVLVVGPDQNNDHFTKAINWCFKNNKEVVVLPRTDGISSTMLREKSK